MTALNVTNTSYLITRTIEQAPSEMMIRELIQNAIEASITAKEPKISIQETDPSVFGFDEKVFGEFGFNNKKLTFWNNGTGMSAKELREVTNLSSSLNKIQRLDQNFGIGAKVTAMGVNQEGMIWISCKNKKVSTSLLRKEINSKGQANYCRYDFVDTDGESPTGYKDVWDISGIPTLPYDTNEDWTAIVLCGNNPNQNTVERPYDGEEPKPSAWLINQIYRRFFRIPNTVSLRLEVGFSKNKDRNVRFLTILDHITYTSITKPDKVIQEFVNDKNGSGIKIWYVYDGPSKNQGYANQDKPTSTATGYATVASFSGLVYKNEIYDVATDSKWKKIAGALGVLYSARYFRIFVELPDESNVQPDQYRQKILKPNAEKTEIQMLEYAREIRENMPEWFKEKIREYAPSNVSSEDITKRAQQLLDELMVTVTKDKGQTGFLSPSKKKGAGNSSNTVSSPKSKQIPYVPGSNFQIAATVPAIQFIRTEDDLEKASATSLEHRAAEYIEDQAIYVNCMYEVIGKAVEELVAEYQTREEEIFEKIKDAAKEIASNEMAWLVTRAVVYSIAKKKRIGYDQEEIEKALHPVSLTTHADSLIYDLTNCSKQLKVKVKEIEDGILISGNLEKVFEFA